VTQNQRPLEIDERFWEDAEEAFDHYFSVDGFALANRFWYDLENALDRVEEAPEAWAFRNEPTRRCRLRVFPRQVVYRVYEHCVYIAAAPDEKQRPYWENRFLDRRPST